MKKAKKIVSIFLSLLIACGVLVTPTYVSAAKKLAAPKKVKAKPKDSSSALITWKKSKNASYYQVFKATSKRGKYKKIGTASKTKKKYIAKKLKTGKTYYFKIKAISGKQSVSSKSIKYKATPAKITGVSIKVQSDSEAKVTWKKQSKISGYKLQYSKTSNFSQNTNSIVLYKKSRNSAVLSNLDLAKYFIKICAFKKVGKKNVYGPYSKTVSYQNKLSPNKVTGLTVTQVSDTSATAKWNSVSKASGYQIVYSKNSNFSGNKTITVKGNSTNKATLTNLEKKTYYIKVRAYRKYSNNTYYGSYSSVFEYIFNALPEDITEKKVDFETDSNTTFTRGQWVSALVKKLNYTPYDKKDFSGYTFSDIANSPYCDDIETAFQNNIIPLFIDDKYDEEQDVPQFKPNEPATREFAAYTSVLSQGFIDENVVLDCEDSSSITYKSQVALSIKNGFLNLVNNKFNPTNPMTGTDKNQIFAKIDQLKTSVEFDTTKKISNIEYQKSVITLNEINYTITNGPNDTYSVTIPKSAGTFNEGDIIILPKNADHPNGFTLKITSKKSSDENNYVLEGTNPKPEEVFTTLQFQGTGEADIDNFKAADGVECERDKNSEVDLKTKLNTGVNADFNKTVSVPGKLTLDLDKKISDSTKLKGKVELSIPEIRARLNAKFGLFSGTKINDFILSVTKKTKLEGKIEATGLQTGYEITHGSGTKEFVPGSWELGRLPIQLCPGLSLDFVVKFTVSVKGEISVSFEMLNTDGIQYTNGSVRYIKEITPDLKNITAKASAKIGLEFELGVWALEAFNIIGIQLDIGLQGDISFTPHFEVNPNVYCGDAKLFAYLTFGTDSDCLFCKITHLGYSCDIWDSKSSPFKKGFHIENGQVKDNCQFSSGTLEGKIVNSSNNPISGACLKIYSGSALINTTYTNSDGSFKSKDLCAGTYDVKVSATGYKKYLSQETITSGQVTYAQTYVMIKRNGINTGFVEGTVKNAINGEKIESGKYEVFTSWNNTSSNLVTKGSFSSGEYDIELDPGNYTILFKCDNFSENYINVAISTDSVSTGNIVLNPNSINANGKIRVVLTWGEYPCDIDSHLFGPVVTGTDTFHVYYGDMEYSSYSNDEDINIVNLDVDDIESYGPETVTINKMNREGTYSYFVHDYSNRYEDYCDELSNSGAIAKVYSGNTLIATFNVPTNKDGTVWHVFDYNAGTDSITPVNSFYYQSDPEYVNEPESYYDY